MPSLKDRDITAPGEPGSAIVGGNPVESTSQQPVAMEVPVTVNGARPLEGNDKREPFSESTKTVLVFGNGAVLRLASAVAPGQLLFVTNEKTKKEVICQVVRSKKAKNRSGYVEVEFTERVSGFWGLRFPADREALRSRTSLSNPDSDADEFLRRTMDTSESVAHRLNSTKPAMSSSNSMDGERAKSAGKPGEPPSIRADSLPDKLASEPKAEAGRLQERLSSLLSRGEPRTSVEKSTPSAEPSAHNASSVSSSKVFDGLELKPLANTAAPREPQLSKSFSAPISASIDAKTLVAEEPKVPTWLQPLTQPIDPQAESAGHKMSTVPATARHESTASEKQSEAQHKFKLAKAVPAFGSGLLGQNAASAAAPRANKGLFIAVAAGLLVALAAVAWCLQQPSQPPTNRAVPVTHAPAAAAGSATQSSAPTTPASAAQTTSSQQEQALTTPADITVHVVATPLPAKPGTTPIPENASATSAARPTQQTAVITERIPGTNSAANAALSPSSGSASDSVELDPKKPSLGGAASVKPKVKKRRTQPGVAAPSLSEADVESFPPSASLGSPLVPNATPQPAAPAAAAAIGGDVKPAKLLSSVPPVYPAIAKSQHLGGDVRIDALIDANGRVSSMKVISGPPLLHQAAMDALRQWKYQAATLNGTAVPMHLTVTIQFHLQ